MRFVRSGAVRQRIYVGHDNRGLDNVPRLKKRILLRDEAARLLGYPNHAECQLEEKMAESTDFVNVFLKDIKEKLTPIAKLELDALLNLKRAHIESTKSTDTSGVVPEEAGTFRFWDFSYYSNLTKVRTHSFDVKKFSEYFSLERSLKGMMSIFSRLFGLQFCKITADRFSKFGPEHVMTRHPDVTVFSVWEDAINGGDFLGYLYLDLFPRGHK
jgi:metallopeptidase MepB